MTEVNVEVFGRKARQSRSWARALFRGARKRCPQCGKGAIFQGYVKTVSACSNCGLEISGHRADDAPPYITIMIVGHIVIPLALAVKQVFDPALWVQFAIWGPVLTFATWWLLPVSKGGLIGLQWANRMHGFSPDPDPGEFDPEIERNS